jgi:membrane associated rhomboid family serine protease
MAVVFGLQGLVGLLASFTPLNLFGLFVAEPRSAPLRTVLSVYAHGGVGHLVGNAVALALVGFALERVTTRLRFHAFFIVTGVVSALAQVYATGGAVLGASGAIFALYGYVATGNPLSRSLLDALELPSWAQAAVFVGLAGAVTLLTASPGVALVGHFAGLFAGLIAGRLRLLTMFVDEERATDPEDVGLDGDLGPDVPGLGGDGTDDRDAFGVDEFDDFDDWDEFDDFDDGDDEFGGRR